MKLQKLKEKVMKLGSRAGAIAKQSISFAVEYAITLTVICALCLGILKLPEMHNKYLRSSVGNKVYMIRDSNESGGGTGFAVKAPSGQSYILTNDHVCEVSSDGLTVLVTGDEGSMRRRIIAHDENSDLCLIEGLPGVEGLSVASFGPSLGDTLNVVGHPLLMPKHVSSGELTGASDVSIPLGPISVINPRTGKEEFISPEEGGVDPKQCTMNKHSQEMVDFDMFFFVLKVKFCVMTVKDAYSTAVTIHPGNSGSPVVNFWGNVVGVAFASNKTNWGRMVPIQDVKSFIKNY
jgi:S1-C subfamily serine protease